MARAIRISTPKTGGGGGGFSRMGTMAAVLGSRPPALRTPRIKPMEGVTQYAKTVNQPPGGGPVPKPAGVGFGDTGQTGES